MDRWLGENEYLCGKERSIADISASHEVDQTKFLEYDIAGWPNVHRWLSKMIDEDEVQMEVATKMRSLAIRFNQKKL